MFGSGVNGTLSTSTGCSVSRIQVKTETQRYIEKLASESNISLKGQVNSALVRGRTAFVRLSSSCNSQPCLHAALSVLGA